ncbi:MAG: 50S ribosomal protein L17 [Deltaproteobacteria bacterium RBG_16_47_11]|nr:MAG: 50S ribosomal protein L17 [Deltaproteobacteria bacterium RBG_16_47_11]
MRHRVAGRKLSRPTQHRELMFRNMLVSLLTHERIKTTLPKAKALRSWADKIITLGKKGDLHARRRAFDLLRNRDTVKKLFEEIVPRFKGREGGYTRIYKLGWRHGDAAPLSLVELTTYAPPEQEKKKSAMKKAKEVLKKVVPRKRGKEEKAEKGEKKEGKKEASKDKPKKKSEKEKSE